MAEERDPDLVNPDWKRPADWKGAADWNSPAWKRMMDESYRKIAVAREQFGFVKCPKCGCAHTGKTMTCRECEFRIDIPL